MSLPPGTRLGPYEVTAQIGVGGMGEVYRATDTNLKRQVAIKVLPAPVAGDTKRLARFQREAEVLAQLNHPNIAQIHGLEKSEGTIALVMELVEGPTLADRIAQGAIPANEALPIAKQIADALEAAHEQGIIHRDLKPANIKVRPDGTVKVLDFGLAKAMESPNAMSPSVSQAPTITTPAMMTGVGMILGTAPYMSPEQACGKAVYKRTDIWAFGAVLFEMLTGVRAFAGDDVSETLARVIEREPEWDRLPDGLPPHVRQTLRLCLRKPLRERVPDMGAVRLALEGAFETLAPSATPANPESQGPRWRRGVGSMVTAAIASLIVGAAVWLATRPEAPRVSRLTIPLSGSAALMLSGLDRNVAITPDGTRVVYLGNNGNQILVRALDAFDPVVIATGELRSPFVSPDGQWVGYFEDFTTLKKVAITGGPSIIVARVDGSPRGATWLPDDTIIFATGGSATGLQRVSVAGGTPEVLTQPDFQSGESAHAWPEALPSGQAVLFTITAQTGRVGLDAAQIAVLDVETRTKTILMRGASHAQYARSGHLVYAVAGTLRAAAFDLAARAVRGTAIPVVSRLTTSAWGAADFALANDGTLVYADAPAGAGSAVRTLVWVDRMGREEPAGLPPRSYLQPRVSPDGGRIAVFAADEDRDVWIWDLKRTVLTRLTSEPATEGYPEWTADGRRVLYSSNSEGGTFRLWWQAVDGTRAAEPLSVGEASNAARTRDGAVVFNSDGSIGRLALDGDRRASSLFPEKAGESFGVVSPDGRWLAYESNRTGRSEVYVGPFPDAASGRWQVSTIGGGKPLWARNGRELFYVAPDGTLMGATVEATSTTWNAGTPRKVLEPRYYVGPNLTGRNYDLSADDRRFLMMKSEEDAVRLIVVQHFDQELARLVPTN